MVTFHDGVSGEKRIDQMDGSSQELVQDLVLCTLHLDSLMMNEVNWCDVSWAFDGRPLTSTIWQLQLQQVPAV